MRAYQYNRGLSPLLTLLKRANLSKSDCCKALQIELNTFNKWLDNPYMIQLGHLCMLSGLTGVDIVELTYTLTRNRPKVDKVGRVFIECIRDKQ